MVVVMMDMNHGRGFRRGRFRSNHRVIFPRVIVLGFIPQPVGRRLLDLNFFTLLASSLRHVRSNSLSILHVILLLAILVWMITLANAAYTFKGLLDLVFIKLAEQGKRVLGCRWHPTSWPA